MASKQYWNSFRGLAILVGLVVLNYGLFAILLDTNYLKWYLENGALIGLMMAFFALVWGDMNRHTGLISGHPGRYVQEILVLGGMWLVSISGMSPKAAIGDWMPSHRYEGCAEMIQDVIALGVWVLIAVGVVAWMVVIAPLQYFVVLICGAPVRAMKARNLRFVAYRTADGLTMWRYVSRDDEVPDGWWDASVHAKPVSATNLIATVLFLALNIVL